MTRERMRQEFEKWAREHRTRFDVDVARGRVSQDLLEQFCWEAWQAGERLGRERAAEICKQDGCDACYDLIRQEPRTP